MEDWRTIKALHETEYIRKAEKEIRKVYLLENYKDIVDEIKQYIKTELEKKYNDIKFCDDTVLVSCYIKRYLFEISLEDKIISVTFYKDESNNGFKCFETFKELFNYIDDIIKKID